MTRGTTPTHAFKLPFDTEQIKTVLISYAQNDEVKLTKRTDDCTLKGNIASVTLSQKDTLAFTGNVGIHVEFRALLKNGSAPAFRPVWIRCDDVLNDEVLT